jgi:hypothetical protein
MLFTHSGHADPDILQQRWKYSREQYRLTLVITSAVIAQAGINRCQSLSGQSLSGQSLSMLAHPIFALMFAADYRN